MNISKVSSYMKTSAIALTALGGVFFVSNEDEASAESIIEVKPQVLEDVLLSDETIQLKKYLLKEEQERKHKQRVRKKDKQITKLKDEVEELEKALTKEKKANEEKVKAESVSNDTGNVSKDSKDERDKESGVGDSSKQGDTTSTKSEAVGSTYEATYYSAFCPTGCTGKTATGHDVSNSIYVDGYRVIAVDPNVIPLKSIVKVTTPNETFEAIALDTGGDITSGRIDILVNSTEEAYRLGRHNVTVEVIK